MPGDEIVIAEHACLMMRDPEGLLMDTAEETSGFFGCDRCLTEGRPDHDRKTNQEHSARLNRFFRAD
ncbi:MULTISPECIES: hypothetical protein [unclassified Roseitalea]|uniref:hypothetical protein n=1 Tax=unclassified Roseitalea TaxID=2639107 RepID=UPI00273F5A49|nr:MULTISPECIES: hypothetical protein [unclassified Roseitalea]